MSKLYWILSRLARALWVRVSAYALLGILAAMFASLGGRLLNGNVPVEVSTEAIEGLLTIIATSMLTVTSFSVGALTSAYSSATSNATPRATPLLTEDQLVQNALATFVGSFLFSIVGIVALKVSVYGPEGRESLENGAGLKLYITPRDQRTVKEVSAAVGSTTREAVTRMYGRNKGFLGVTSTSARLEERPLLSETEARGRPS